MHKHSTVILLGILVVFLSAYILWSNKVEQRQIAQMQQTILQLQSKQTMPEAMTPNSVSSADTTTTSDSYLTIPELKIRFTKVPGLTLSYTLGDNNAINFSAEELNAEAAKDPSIQYCTADTLFPGVQVTNSNDFAGTSFIPLADGRYLALSGQQAPCYNGTIPAASLQFLKNQADLFSTFAKSVQSY